MYTAQGAIIDTDNMNIKIPNGYIHIVKLVLSVPSQNVYGLVAGDSSLSSLKTAIDSAGLKSTLEGLLFWSNLTTVYYFTFLLYVWLWCDFSLILGTGPVTVFAPDKDVSDLDELDTNKTTELEGNICINLGS